VNAPSTAVGRAENQIAVRVDGGLGTVDLPCDAAGVGARGDHKVVLQLPLIAVEDQIHAGIDLGEVDFAKGLDAGVPFLGIVADQVADRAGLRIEAGDGGVGAGAHQLHAQCVNRSGLPDIVRCRAALPLKVQDNFIFGQEERVAGAARKKLHAGVGLALVGFEAERNLAVIGRCELGGVGWSWRGGCSSVGPSAVQQQTRKQDAGYEPTP